MKVCFLAKTLDEKRGEGRFALELINSLKKDKEIELVVLTEVDDHSDLAKPILKKSLGLNHILNIFINAFRARKYVKTCDIIHALDGYPYGVIAALTVIGLKKRVIITGVGTYTILPLDKSIIKILTKWAYKRVYKILCISNFTKDQILKRIKLDNIDVISLGVDYDKFQKVIALEGNGSKKIILSVGALKPRKGYHISIPAIVKIKKRYPNIKYYIVGGRPPKIYSDLVKNLKLEKNIEFLENLSDEELIKLYYQSDIFLLVPVTINDNDFEGFGLAYLEAGACGKPVIGTYNCGAEDAIINNKTGFLVSPNDINATSKFILKLLDDSGLARGMGKEGRIFAQKMSWDNVIKKYLSFYK